MKCDITVLEPFLVKGKYVYAVSFTDEQLGSFEWKLPTGLSETLAFMPPDARTEMLETLTRHVRGHATILMGALNSEQFAGDFLRILAGHVAKAASEMTLVLQGASSS